MSELVDVSELRGRLIDAYMRYDEKEYVKPGYNRHAMAICLGRVDEVVADVERGTPVRAAICAGFNGRLATALLKSVGEPRWTLDDQNRRWSYAPVTDAGAAS